MKHLFNDLEIMKESGFTGFYPLGDLMKNNLVDKKIKGVYFILYLSDIHPVFMEKGSGGYFKGRDPNVSIEVLTKKWVENTKVVYIGKGGEKNSESTLFSRLSQYLSFGQGNIVGHSGGRYIFQLKDYQELLVCWKEIKDDPEETESGYLSDFQNFYDGRLPFGNLKKGRTKKLILHFGMEGYGEKVFQKVKNGKTIFIRQLTFIGTDLDDWKTKKQTFKSIQEYWEQTTEDPQWFRFHPVMVHKDYKELVLKSLQSIDLEIIDVNQKGRIDCWVDVLMDGKYSTDYPFKNLCRLHQSQYRSDVLKVWFDEDINVLNEEDGLKGLNFYDGFDILKSVEGRYGDRFKGGFRKPLYCNLLRSEHIPFNFFIPFKHDLNFCKKVFNEILGDIIDHLIDIRIEFPEKTPTVYLEDKTSFDTYIEYKHIDGTIGILGIEVKYTELSYPIGVKEKREMENPESLYYIRSRESGVFIVCNFNTLRTLSKDDFRQVWRNHLLGESILILDKLKFGHFHSLTFYPDGNIHFTKVINEYREFLNPNDREKVQGVTYERFIEICREHLPKNGLFEKWLKYLERRYIVHQ